jgi:carboxymethylenebutenolidase
MDGIRYRAWVGGLLGLSLLAFGGTGGAPATGPSSQQQQRQLPPFLEIFQGEKETPVTGQPVTIPSAVSPVRAYLARPENQERLPAVLFLPGARGLDKWMKQNVHDLASVGYVVLAVDRPAPAGKGPRPTSLDEETMLAGLSAAVRWLRRRPDVLPAQVGVIGFGAGGTQALLLAGNMPLQACVVHEGTFSEDPGLLAGLHSTAVLGICGARDEAAQKALPGVRQALARAQIVHKFRIYEKAGRGFLGPPEQKSYVHEAAEDAWVDIYEFLGKYVEDAPDNPVTPGSATPESATRHIATIADLMRVMHGQQGLREALFQSLETKPASASQWAAVRARAALLAETGHLLQLRTPHKGSHHHYREQARAYTMTAEAIVQAADRQDFAGLQQHLQELSTRCAACHKQHR